MKRVELEHIIRAAAGLTDEREFIIVGAAALLGSVPAPPAELAQTLEADIYPRRKPELSELIEGSMGELSLFHDTHRYYAHGVGPDTAKLPSGWETRLVAIQGTPTNGAVGYCVGRSLPLAPRSSQRAGSALWLWWVRRPTWMSERGSSANCIDPGASSCRIPGTWGD